MTKMIQDVSDCRKCYARKTIGEYTPVNGMGAPDAEMMIVKDRPNMAAIEMGEPIDEIEKKILANLLLAAYINIDETYITTVTKCPSHLKAEVINQCKPYLWNEIKEVNPKVIITLGSFVTNLLTKTSGAFRRSVGKVISVDYMEPKIIPAYQPFWIMQNPARFRHYEVMALLKGKNLMNRAIGRVGEEFIRRVLLSADIECEFNTDPEKYIEYDLVCKLGRKKFTVEVKHDVMSSKTGNLCIEVRNVKSDTPSGVYGSTANLVAYVLNDGSNLTAWLISRLALIKYIENVEPKKVIECGGDNNAKLLLYPDMQILKEFSRIDNVGVSEIKKVVRKLLK